MNIYLDTLTLAPGLVHQAVTCPPAPDIGTTVLVHAQDGTSMLADVVHHMDDGLFHVRTKGEVIGKQAEPPQAVVPDDVTIDPDDDSVVCWGDAAVGGEALEGAVDLPEPLPTCERCGRMLIGPCTAHVKVKLR
jgi:hypothetical protein